MSIRKVAAVVAVAALITVILSAMVLSTQPRTPVASATTPTPSPSRTDDASAPVPFAGAASPIPDASATDGQTALAVLATLAVKGRAAATGFDRDEFGQRWLDVDRNGCDTRNDTLAAQLTEVVRSGPCTVTSGILADPFTGRTIAFVRGETTSELVQVDHVVALADAWRKGAQLLTPDQRAAFANDPLNLLAVDGPANAQKGDGDAATWLPSNKTFRCAYVARQVAVKATYRLWVTQPEHDAIARILADCPNEPAPASTSAAAVPAPADPAPPAPPANVYYANCAEVRVAGAAPIFSGDPGYSRDLDRDGDGVACES